MLFNSYPFVLLFLPLGGAVYWLLLKSQRARQIGLLCLNIVFYSAAGPGELALLLASASITYVAARYLISSASPSRRRLGLVITLSNLMILLGFKVLQTSSTSSILLPLGISFYTFNLVGYGLDVYKRRLPAESSLLKFLIYISFFPTIASGPLVRYAAFKPQAEANSTLDGDQAVLGLFNLIIGLAKKLIVADYLATIVNPLFAGHDQLGVIGAWIAVLGYTFQIYFDFSAYSDMAVGVGYLFGFKLPPNFNAPYAAQSITEFWARWHITLSTWFREYLFLPLSRLLLKWTAGRGTAAIRTLSLILTMALIGLWHGLSWTFLLWGVYYGCLLAIHAQFRGAGEGSTWQQIASRVVTFFLVMLGWVLFRSPSVQIAIAVYAALFGVHGWGIADLQRLPSVGLVEIGFVFIGLLVVTNFVQDTGQRRPRLQPSYAIGLGALFVLCLLLMTNPLPFIYFKF